MRKNNKKKNQTKHDISRASPPIEAYNMASSTVGEKFIFTKLMHKKFFKNKKTRNNFFFLFIVYSTR